jgi:SAM-dependent methyltransferase
MQVTALSVSGRFDPYQWDGEVYVPPRPVAHRDAEYDSQGFDLLRRMQQQHFWYRGRHRFLLHGVRRYLADTSPSDGLSAVDLGGGCGGWLAYLLDRPGLPLRELALADSSRQALRLAGDCLPPEVGRYQIDLLDLQWRERWNVAFLLDVLEHIPDERAALREVREALVPGGLLFVTVPALRFFWSWNDELVSHQRRYSKGDFVPLAADCGLSLLDARYFMFFLSPLLLLARRGKPVAVSREAAWEQLRRMHEVPHPVVNAALGGVFALETPPGHVVRFPWGTSLLAVFQRT